MNNLQKIQRALLPVKNYQLSITAIVEAKDPEEAEKKLMKLIRNGNVKAIISDLGLSGNPTNYQPYSDEYITDENNNEKNQEVEIINTEDLF